MQVQELLEQGFTALSLPDPEREIEGVYIGDLLSWVMGRAQAGNAWITIMSNVNVLAVATLADTAAVILAEEVELDAELAKQAEMKDVNVLKTALPAYECAVLLHELLK